MSDTPDDIHPHDADLPKAVRRKRDRNRSMARWLLTFAVLCAAPGWGLYALSFRDFMKQSPFLVIVAYVFLIISSVTLVLGFWYLLLAQVQRLARIAGEEDVDAPQPRPLCQNCGWFYDAPDRFCRHCGKPLKPTDA